MEDNCPISRWEILKNQLNNLPPKAFKTALENQTESILIDCRTLKEFETGHLSNAVNMDYLGEGFYDQMERLDLEKSYLIYCRSGRRSTRTCTLMKNAGFKNIYNLDGGLKEWARVLGDI